MSRSVPALLLAGILLSACQPTSSIVVPISTAVRIEVPAEASATASPETTPSEVPASEVEMVLPPSGKLLSRVEVGDQPLFALTIDDGWRKPAFDFLLDELRARHLHATFFLVGIAVNNLGPERMAQLAADGHTLAYHSYSHDEVTVYEGWNNLDWIADFDAWEELVKEVMGEENYAMAFRPYARAPYGLFTKSFLHMTEARDLVPVGWSVAPDDLNVGLEIEPGDIFLIHVRFPDARDLPDLLDSIPLQAVSLDELIEAGNGNQ
jgi:peptidoglycan/xylan/chitin deacetylase (PgdA/CDA1 family)